MKITVTGLQKTPDGHEVTFAELLLNPISGDFTTNEGTRVLRILRLAAGRGAEIGFKANSTVCLRRSRRNVFQSRDDLQSYVNRLADTPITVGTGALVAKALRGDRPFSTVQEVDLYRAGDSGEGPVVVTWDIGLNLPPAYRDVLRLERFIPGTVCQLDNDTDLIRVTVTLAGELAEANPWKLPQLYRAQIAQAIV